MRFIVSEVPLWALGLLLGLGPACGRSVVSAPADTACQCPSQGYLAHKKTPYPRTLHYAYAYGPMTVLGGWRFCCERGYPIVTLEGKLKRFPF